MTLDEISNITGGELICESANKLSIDAIATDSRKAMPEHLFVALKGESFDAHDYISQVEQQGASALVVERAQETKLPQIVVNNSLTALGQIANFQRKTHAIPTIALTGSCGKTTTKEMLLSILSQKGKVHATQGNFNNEFGVPFTLFNLTEDDQFSIIELGAGKPGDIDYLSAMVMPDVALITTVAEAHIEGMGSLEGVARTKGEILNHLIQNGVAVLPKDSQWLSDWKAKLLPEQKLMTFSVTNDADLSASNIIRNEQSTVFDICHLGKSKTVEMSLMGQHNISNALAASAAAIALGASLDDCAVGLSEVTATAGRLKVLKGLAGSRIIDDSYNGNPSSILAAADVLSEFSGRKVLILGDMAELGPESKNIHLDLGSKLKSAGIDQVLTVGKLSAYISESYGGDSLHFNSKQALSSFIETQLNSNFVVLIKGSRSAGMEDVVARLVEEKLC